jgi:hypothetical protein
MRMARDPAAPAFREVMMTGLAARGHAGLSSGDLRHAVAGLPSPGRRERWSTPGRVMTAAAAVVLLTCLLAALTAAVSGRLAGDFHAIGQRDAPEVGASAGLYFALNDMDAQVANVLLVSGDASLAADRSQDMAIYAGDRATADQDLQQATVTEAADPVALGELRTVLDRIGQYEALAADALLADRRDAGTPAPDTAGRAPAAALAYWRQASDLMQSSILPTVDSLTSVSSGELTARYQAGRGDSRTGLIAVAVVGALLIAALTALQVSLTARYRRLVNPALAAATLAAIAFTAVAATRFDVASSDLKVAKQDAFDSILALTQARAVSYDANADESRYLVDPKRAAQYQQAFLAKSLRLADVGRVPISGYDAALATDLAAYDRDHADVRFGGYLGAEFRNITFPGERAAAQATLLAFQRYERDDRTLRALAEKSLTAAVAYDVGTARGESDWAFNQYDAALSAVLAINARAFTAQVQAGQGAIAGWNLGLPAAGAVLLAALTLAGVWPRLAEYN